MDTRPTSIADICWIFIQRKWSYLWYPKWWTLQIELHAKRWYPYGAETTLKENGYEPDPAVREIYSKYVNSYNDGIFRAYT